MLNRVIACLLATVTVSVASPINLSFDKVYPLTIQPGGSVLFQSGLLPQWTKYFSSILVLVNANGQPFNASVLFELNPGWYNNITYNCSSCGLEYGRNTDSTPTAVSVLFAPAHASAGLVADVEFRFLNYPTSPQANRTVGKSSYKFDSYSDIRNVWFEYTREGVHRAARALFRISRNNTGCQTGLRFIIAQFGFDTQFGLNYDCTFTSGEGNIEYPITIRDWLQEYYFRDGLGVSMMIFPDPSFSNACLTDLGITLEVEYFYDDVFEPQQLNYSDTQAAHSAGYYYMGKENYLGCASVISTPPCFRLPDPSPEAVAHVSFSALGQECAIDMVQYPPLSLMTPSSCRDSQSRYNISLCDSKFVSSNQNGTVICLQNTGVANPTPGGETPPQHCNGSALVRAVEFKPPIHDINWDGAYFNFYPNRTWGVKNIMTMRLPATPAAEIYRYEFGAYCYYSQGYVYLRAGQVPAAQSGSGYMLQCNSNLKNTQKVKETPTKRLRLGSTEDCYEDITNVYKASWCCRDILTDTPLYASAQLYNPYGKYDDKFNAIYEQWELVRQGSDTLNIVNTSFCSHVSKYYLFPGVPYTGNISIRAVFTSNAPWEGSSWREAATLKIWPSKRPRTCGTSLYGATDVQNGYWRPSNWSQPLVVAGTLQADEFTREGLVVYAVVDSDTYTACGGPINATLQITVTQA